ncbi:hypothetical protein [Pseudomonas sp. PDM11]|uniref:hypothetical protein n=1 Tax=Pseudomonas sp. PDM11 TaxID=2769309 RepID=UPI001780361B|nr:hypothetical protein [Pseudomonas sp. PDM11]MBD9398304.1 hypothetical protein [Pseudomonas sp. PDM11]
MSRLRDFGYSLLIATLVPVLHHLFDAAYYTDLWVFRYDYIPIILIPLACLIICSIAKPEPFFLTGVSLAFSLPLIAMFAYTTIWPVVDGRGLDYFLGSLGAFLGALLSLAYLKHKKGKAFARAIWVGFTGTIAFYTLTQQYFCNTGFACGPFSLIFYTK